MTLLTKILSAATLGLLLIVGLQTVRVHNLKAEAADAREQHATALAKALQTQAADLSAQTILERKAKEDRERQVATLTRELKTMRDYNENLTPVLHRHISGMLQRAAEPTGLVPAGSGTPARTFTATGGSTTPGS
jgi:uncharacterized membrane protein YbjE (DUF340 family)